MAWTMVGVLSVACLALLYTSLIAWYALRVEAWRGHAIFPPSLWKPPQSHTTISDSREIRGDLWKYYK